MVIYQGGGGAAIGARLESALQTMVQVPEAYLVMVSGGPLHEALRAQAAELGLIQRAHFFPTVPLAELPSYTASADIRVQPIENTCLNHYTTDSNKLFEYVLAGLPVVASDLPEIRRILRRHDLGLLVPVGDSEALAEALCCMVTDAELRRYHAARARAAAAELSWEVQEHVLVDLYRRILG